MLKKPGCFSFLVLGDLEKKRGKEKKDVLERAGYFSIGGSKMNWKTADQKEEFDSSPENTMSPNAGKAEGGLVGLCFFVLMGTHAEYWIKPLRISFEPVGL